MDSCINGSIPIITFHEYHAAPIIAVTIQMGDINLGQNHELICNASGAEKLKPRISYRWTKMNDTGTVTEVGTNSSTLSFSSLYLSDAGRFTCEVTITSDFLTGSITKENTTKLQFSSKLIGIDNIYCYMNCSCSARSSYC